MGSIKKKKKKLVSQQPSGMSAVDLQSSLIKDRQKSALELVLITALSIAYCALTSALTLLQ